MKEKMKKHKKLIAGVAVILVVAIVAVTVMGKVRGKRDAMMAGMPTQDTAEVERRTLVESVSATGTVSSVASKDVTADVTGVEVVSVNVKVGDRVEAGEVLCALDTTGIEEDLADARTSLSVTSQKTQIELSASERSLSEAQESRNIDLERADEDLAAAWEDYLEALTDLEEAEDELEAAKTTTIEKNGEYEYRQELLEEAEKKAEGLKAGAGQNAQYEEQFGTTLTSLKSYVSGMSTVNGALDNLYIGNGNLSDYNTYDKIVSGLDASSDADKISDINGYLTELLQLQSSYQAAASADSAYKSAQAEYETIKAEVTSWQSKYNTAKTSESSLEKNYESAQQTVDSKLDAYNQKVRSKEDTVRNNESSVSNKEDSLATTKLNASTSGQSDKQKIREYEEQLEECTVIAPISGTITAVNVEAGDKYSGTAIVTIEDDSTYEVHTEIDEYDIGEIEQGQKVVIKTNGTGDKEFDGTVQTIAPRATTGSSGVTYAVTISIDSPCQELRMDMTAKLSIILESKENVLTVPYDALQQEADGSYYVEIVKGELNTSDTADGEMPDMSELLDLQEMPDVSGTSEKSGMKKQPAESGQTASLQTEKIKVTKGIESDYYVEVISTQIEEGMTVVVPASQEEGMNIQQMMGGRGPMGGF